MLRYQIGRIGRLLKRSESRKRVVKYPSHFRWEIQNVIRSLSLYTRIARGRVSNEERTPQRWFPFHPRNWRRTSGNDLGGDRLSAVHLPVCLFASNRCEESPHGAHP